MARVPHAIIAGLLTLLAVAASSASLVTVGALKDAALARLAAGEPLVPGALLGTLGPIDVLLAIAALVPALALVVLEWRRRAISRFLAEAPEGWRLMGLTALLGALGHAYLFPGVLLGGDAGSHIARFYEVGLAFAEGHWPAWTTTQYLGSPLLGFTGPLAYALGGALTVATGGDPLLAAKLYLFALHIASGLAFYAAGRRFGLPPSAALLAALGYAGAFAHLHLFLYRGVYPQAIVLVLLPLLFFSAEGLMRDMRLRAGDLLIFALSVAGLVLSHQPHALFAGVYLGVYGLGALALGRWQWRRIAAIAPAAVLGLAMGAWAVAPILAEADAVMIDPGGGLFQIRAPTPERLLRLGIWANTLSSRGTDYWAYLGLPLIALAIWGATVAFTRPSAAPQRGFVAALLPALALAFVLTNPVVRDVMFLLFFVGLLAGVGLMHLPGRGTWPLALAALLILVDTGSTAIQPLARTDKHFFGEAGRRLAAVAPAERVLEIAIARDGELSVVIGPVANPMSATARVLRVAGYHNMAATRIHNWAVVALKRAEADLRTMGTLAPATHTLLGLFGVTRAVCFLPDGLGCPQELGPAREDKVLGAYLPVGPTSQIVFSQRLAPFAPDVADVPMLWEEDFDGPAPTAYVAAIERALDAYLTEAGIDLATGTAAALPARIAPGATHAAPAPGAWTPRLIAADVGLETWRFEIETDAPGYAQLSLPWYPYLHVQVNGADVEAGRGALNHLIVAVPSGRSVVTVAPAASPVRIASAWIAAAAFIVTLGGAGGFALWQRRRA